MSDSTVLIDTHVHIYPQFDLNQFFRSAYKNFSSLDPDAIYIMVLTERESEDYFNLLSTGQVTGDFKVTPTLEPHSIKVSISDSQEIFIIAGRQANTIEGLEVLSLGRNKIIPSKLPIKETIRTISEFGGVPVIPWSFGKWTGKRKKVVCDLIQESLPSDFLIGDIPSRNFIFASNDIFKMAGERGFRFIYGSDPLPLSTDTSLPGSYSAHTKCNFNSQTPSVIRDLLLSSTCGLEGRKLNSLNSIYRQVLLRIHV